MYPQSNPTRHALILRMGAAEKAARDAQRQTRALKTAVRKELTRRKFERVHIKTAQKNPMDCACLYCRVWEIVKE